MSELFKGQINQRDRRGFLKYLAAGVIAAALTPKEVLGQERDKIVPVEYEQSKGLHRSYPWLPHDGSLEGEEATGFNAGGPWDKYDELDRLINGGRARSVYWPRIGGPASTRDWLIRIAYKELHGKGYENYLSVRGWSGYCMDAISASYFAPKIEGGINILGIEFSERDRMVVADLRWGGLDRHPIDTASQELTDRIKNHEPVTVNHSIDGVSDWWGLAVDVDSDGRIIINRSIKWHESGLVLIDRYPSQLKGEAYLLDEHRPHPNRKGNFAMVDHLVGGLIVGTHKLAA